MVPNHAKRLIYHFRKNTQLRVTFKQQKTSLTGRPAILEQKRFQDLLNSMGLILNSIQGH